MSTRIVQVDAFTAQPFSGNPAAVCVLPGPRDDGWMRNVAREMNLSETAFLHPVVAQEGDGYKLRWLTPPLRWTCVATPHSPARTSFGRMAICHRILPPASTHAAAC